VLGLALSPDGSQIAIATGGDDQEAGFAVRALPGGERLATLPSDGPVPTAEGVAVAFSPDGRLLAGGGVGNDLLLWSTDGWRQVGRLPAASGLGMAFSPDGSTLATSPGEAVALWDVASQQPIGSPLPLSVGSDAYVATGFAPDGAHLFAVSDDSGKAIRFEVDPEAWVQHACTVAGGDLTPEQWEQVVPEQEYRPVCPSG
jgi:WD40 repeat protein